MIVSRTETYTDWVYQSAHAGEQAAWIGVGLLSGTIYFRYSYDFLREGETVTRETFHAHLSDGSTYELGTGLAAEKVGITYEGQSSDGLVVLSVRGTKGIGVSRITRNATIEYDDGRTPVLDTEQLDGILANLKDSLTGSMVSTAEAVKTELREELETKGLSLKESVMESLTSKSAELMDYTDAAVVDVRNELEETISEELDDKLHTGTFYMTGGSVAAGATLNLSRQTVNSKAGSVVFVQDTDNSSIRMEVPAGRYRTLRVSLTASITPTGGADGLFSFQMRNIKTYAHVSSYHYLKTGAGNRLQGFHMCVEFPLPNGDSDTTTILSGGVRMVLQNNTGTEINIENNAKLVFTLLS